MRLAHTIVAALAVLSPPAMAQARDVAASAPFDVSVTVYRDPYRDEGGFNLNYLGGFALITESRRVVLEPGVNQLRFEGVADGIEAVSAIVTGLPSGVIEKNRDAALLSPSALIESAQAQGGRAVLARTNPGTGELVRSEGIIRSGADGGVVFQTDEGIEALRCSGMPETFSFESSTTGLSPLPTLSVLTRTSQRIEAVVQLSYLSRGFDWAADYTVDMKPGAKFDLGGWVTLANGNGTSFPNARVQVVAGRLNRESGDVEPIDIGRPILARCWPQGSTSNIPPPMLLERGYADEEDRVVVTGSLLARAPSVQDAAQAVTVLQEELGDLKLYRVPDRTTVASRQSKQVRLLDRAAVPVTRLYEADIRPNRNINYQPMTILLRTRNDRRNNLGLPLPSGRVAVFEPGGSGASAPRLLSAETDLRDIAVDEETELRLSESPDVQIRQIKERLEVVRPAPPFLPGVDRRGTYEETTLIEITNARPFSIQAEVRLGLQDGMAVVRSDRRVEMKNGRPIFRVTVPANSTFQIRYQTTIG
jgi:hypothetical protein